GQTALGIPDRRRHARGREHVRARRQAVRSRLLRRQRVDRFRARRSPLVVRARWNIAAGPTGHAGATPQRGAAMTTSRSRRDVLRSAAYAAASLSLGLYATRSAFAQVANDQASRALPADFHLLKAGAVNVLAVATGDGVALV